MNNFPGNSRRNRNLIIFFVLLGLVVLIISFSLSYVLLNNRNSSPTISTTGSPTSTAGTGPATCNGQGVSKNADGSYSFSWLHVNGQGQVVDSGNGLVHLVRSD